MLSDAMYHLSKRGGHYYATAYVNGHGFETFEISGHRYYLARLVQRIKGKRS